MGRGKTAATLENVQSLVTKAFGDGESVGQHVAAASFSLALLQAEGPRGFRERAAEFAETMIIRVFSENLKPETRPL